MRKLFLLAIMLTGSFALANHVKPNVSSEINEESKIVTQTDTISFVQNDVSSDYQYQITETALSSEELRCFINVCFGDGSAQICSGWIEIDCDATIIITVY